MSNKFVVEGGLSVPSGQGLEIGSNSLTSIEIGDTLSTLDAKKNVIPSEYSVATYVASQLTSSALTFTSDGNEADLTIDLDSETLIIAGGSNLTTSAAGDTITVALDATVSGLTSVSSTTITDGTASLTGGSWTSLVDVTMTGDLTSSTITNTEFTVDADGNTDIDGTLNVEGESTFQSKLNLGTNAIEGTADEMIISADGSETSASGSAANSLSLNASGGIFTDDAVDMDSTLNVEGVATFQAQSVHSSGLSVTGAVAMSNSSKKDFEVAMTGSAVEIVDLSGFESGKIVLKVKDSNGNITTKEILAVNGAHVEYATISTGTEVAMTIAVSSDSVTVNSASGTAKGSVDLIK